VQKAFIWTLMLLLILNARQQLRMLLSSVVLPCKPLFIRLAGQHFSLGQFTVDLNKN